MKKDWFGAFLPFWMFGTIAWLVIGFTLMPEAFRRPLFRDHKEVWVNAIYDPTDIDPEIALKIGLILGLPVAVVVITMAVATIQRRGQRRRERQAMR